MTGVRGNENQVIRQCNGCYFAVGVASSETLRLKLGSKSCVDISSGTIIWQDGQLAPLETLKVILQAITLS